MEQCVIKNGDAKLDNISIIDSTNKIAVIALEFSTDSCYVYGTGSKSCLDTPPVISIAKRTMGGDISLTAIEFEQFYGYDILSYAVEGHTIHVTLINWLNT